MLVVLNVVTELDAAVVVANVVVATKVDGEPVVSDPEIYRFVAVALAMSVLPDNVVEASDALEVAVRVPTEAV